MNIERAIFRFAALLLAIAAVSACAPVPPREDVMASGVTTSNWQAGQMFSNNIDFEQGSKRTRFGNALEMALRKFGWFTTSPDAKYRLSYKIASQTLPKPFSLGSEGRVSIYYELMDSSKSVIWNATVYSYTKLTITQSLLGAEGVAQAVEDMGNDNLKQFLSYLDALGATEYTKNQSKLSDDEVREAFVDYNLFSSSSFFVEKPYSSMSFGARTKLLASTKKIWLKRFMVASSHERKIFLDEYGPYLNSNDRAEVENLAMHSKPQPLSASTSERLVPAIKRNVAVEHKNPF